MGLLRLLFCAALGARLCVSSQTPIPREDGVNYLWMAERFAAGDASQALGEIFSPLLALGIAAMGLCTGLDTLAAAQLFLALCGALCVFPAARLGEQLRPGLGPWAALLAALGSARMMQLGAAVYTEPLFVLLSAWGLERCLRQRFWQAGIFCALAFWVRPEAPLLLAAGFAVDRRNSWRAAIPLVLAVLALALWRGLLGHGYDPVPKLAFIRAHNVAEPGAQWAHIFAVPGIALEALGPLLFLVLLGLSRRRPAPYLLVWALAILVICAYVPRWRFLCNWEFLAWPLAALGLRQLPRPGLWVAGVLVFAAVQALLGGTEANRIAERDVGRFLAARLRPGERIAGDMTRVLYFAGQRPLPPRHHQATELVHMARSARFLVLRSRRPSTPEVLRALPDWRPVALPAPLAALAKERGMTILGRP